MGDDMKTLRKMGSVLSEAIGDGPETPRIAAQEQAWLDHFRKIQTGGSRRLWLLIPAFAAAAAIVGIVLAVALRPEKTVPFWLGPHLTALSEGARWESSPREPQTIRFQDGSLLTLEGVSAGQIQKAREHHVEVALLQGELAIDIEHSQTRQWVFLAGPYRIEDLGTVFRVSWDPRQRKLTCAVDSGKVQVEGPGISQGGVQLKANERLQVDPQTASVHPIRKDEGQSTPPARESRAEPEPPAARPTPAGQADQPAGATPAEQAVSPTGPGRPKAIRADEEPTRPRKAARGTPRKRPTPAADEAPARSASPRALAQGYAPGPAKPAPGDSLSSPMQSLLLPELWELAESSRLEGKSDTAKLALHTVRQRFREARRARIAAFLLGRIEMEQLNHPELAARWFSTYLLEEPQGSLAEEALGRLINAYQQSGQKQLSLQAAQQYLALYPAGLFSTLAKSVISSQ